MPKQVPLVRLGFTEGAKTSFDPSSVSPNALWDALNVRSDVSGILRVRYGFSYLFSSLGAGSMQAFGNGFGKMIGVWNRTFYTITTAGVTSAQGTAILGADANAKVRMINWAKNGSEIVYLFPGNGVFQTTGTAPTLVTPYVPATGEKTNLINNAGAQKINSGPARCTIAILRASLSQRIALAGDPQSPNTVYLSEPLDSSYFRDDQTIQLPDDGGKITGMANWYNALIIFRDRDVWAFFGSSATDTTASLVLQDAAIGCINGDTIAIIPGLGLLFLGKDNVYQLQGVTAIANQVKAIPLVIDVIGPLRTAIDSSSASANAVYFDREYRLYFPDCDQSKRVFRFHQLVPVGWYMDSGPLLTATTILNGKMYGANSKQGQVLHLDESILDGTDTIQTELYFRREDLQPGPSRIKKIYIYLLSKGRTQSGPLFYFSPSINERPFNAEETDPATFIVGTSQHLNVSAIVDGNEFKVTDFKIYAGQVNQASLSRSEPVLIFEARFNPSLKGNFVQLKISSNTNGEDIAIMGYGIEFANRVKIHGRKGGVTL